jgi:hypothetical protein
MAPHEFMHLAGRPRSSSGKIYRFFNGMVRFHWGLQDTYACAPLRLRNVNEMNMQVLDSGRTMSWIFREVYNWSRADGDVWPETLWPFIR